MVERITKAVIPVAGLGTRMLPATKAIPKELLVQEAIAGGTTEFILVNISENEVIEIHFDAQFEVGHKQGTKGEKTILGTVKNTIPEKISKSPPCVMLMLWA